MGGLLEWVLCTLTEVWNATQIYHQPSVRVARSYLAANEGLQSILLKITHTQSAP